MVNDHNNSRTADGRKKFSVSTSAENDRPIGITILSILHLVGGILMFGMAILTYATLGSTGASLSALGIPPILLFLGILFLAVLAVASGIGMWIGDKRGWWIAAFYYVYSLFRYGAAIIAALRMSELLADESRGLGFYVVKFGGRIVIHLLILLYLFSDNVLDYFQLGDLNKWRAFGVFVTICLTIICALQLFTGVS